MTEEERVAFEVVGQVLPDCVGVAHPIASHADGQNILDLLDVPVRGLEIAECNLQRGIGVLGLTAQACVLAREYC